jgi:hypothetical protein
MPQGAKYGVRAGLAFSVFLFSAVLIAPPARGGIIAYTSRPTWIAAGGSPTVAEDFHTFASDTPFRNNTIVNLVGGMSLTELGPLTQSDANMIDVSPFVNNENVNGTTDALLAVDNSGTPSTDTVVRLTFGTPTIAWGADFANAAGGDIAAADLFNASNVLLGTISVATQNQFLGFTTTAGDTVKYMNFHGATTGGASGVREFFQIDNLSLPEPGGLALLSGALLAMARRKRVPCAR